MINIIILNKMKKKEQNPPLVQLVGLRPRLNRKRLIMSHSDCSVVRMEIYQGQKPNVLMFVNSESDYHAFGSIADALRYLSDNFILDE